MLRVANLIRNSLVPDPNHGVAWAPFTTTCHHCGSWNPITPNKSHAALLASSKQGDADMPAKSRMTRWHHGQTVSPTGPTRRAPHPNTTPEAQSSHRQREGGDRTTSSHWLRSINRMSDKHCHNVLLCVSSNWATAEARTTPIW